MVALSNKMRGGAVAERSQYEELARQISAVGVVKRALARTLPAECPSGSAAVLALVDRYGEMRMSRLAALLAVDMSVTSRHVAHVVERGWIERSPDPDDRRSRILRLTPRGTKRSDNSARCWPASGSPSETAGPTPPVHPRKKT
jgi:hypothetical protein